MHSTLYLVLAPAQSPSATSVSDTFIGGNCSSKHATIHTRNPPKAPGKSSSSSSGTPHSEGLGLGWAWLGFSARSRLVSSEPMLIDNYPSGYLQEIARVCSGSVRLLSMYSCILPSLRPAGSVGVAAVFVPSQCQLPFRGVDHVARQTCENQTVTHHRRN